jgi:formylglycine-generating enzyme required for sulfatase activity
MGILNRIFKKKLTDERTEIVKPPVALSNSEAGLQGSRVDNEKQRKNAPPGMVWIPGGTFIMGEVPFGIGIHDTYPQHNVILSGFYMDIYPVAQAEFERVIGKNPSNFKGCPDCPVESVSWLAAMNYCEKVGKRLPSQAEWEYAYRAGSTTKYYWGDEFNGEYAWHKGNSDDKTHPVGQKKPNAWGLYDMAGNVWEWCADWNDSGYYKRSPSKNPTGPDSGKERVLRGGSWGVGDVQLRAAYSTACPPDGMNPTFGFRAVCGSHII